MTTTQLAAAPPHALASEQFLQHMEAMRLHYLPAAAMPRVIARPFVMPAHIVELASAPLRANATVDAALNAALQAAQTDALGFVGSHHQAVTSGIASASANTKAFIDRMHALEQAEITEQAARIHRLFDTLSAAGRAYPGHQALILVTSNATGGFLADLLHGARTATHAITATFHGLTHVAAEAVHAAASAAGHWASGAVQSVKHFFSSIF